MIGISPCSGTQVVVPAAGKSVCGYGGGGGGGGVQYGIRSLGQYGAVL